MTEERKDELKSFIVYLDINKMDKEGALSAEGLCALMEINNTYPRFSDAGYRRKLAAEIFDAIDKS